MNRQPPRLFIECSATYYRGLNTGIQRVVRNIVRRSPHHAQRLGLQAVPVVSRFGQFWVSEEFHRLKTGGQATSSFLRLGNRLASWLEDHEKGVIERAQRRPSLMVYAYGISGLRRIVRVGGFLVLRSRFLGQWLRGRVHRIRPRAGDILLMPDAFWAYDVITPLQRQRYQPLCVIPLIHDLIPVSHPQYFAPELVASFSVALPRLYPRSRGFVTVSNATASALRQELERAMGSQGACMPIATCHPGADLLIDEANRSSGRTIRPEITERHPPDRTFLMVGTIEPRKGYDLVYKALSRLWDRGLDHHLVIVGRVGWKCEPLLQEMSLSRHYGRSLYVYHDISDPELDYLYRHVSALIFASRVEGFGLPLVEAMQRALPVIASDIPVFREIAGDYPEYFRNGDVGDLMRVLADFRIGTPGVRRQAGIAWRTWDDAVGELVSLCISMAQGSGDVAPPLDDRGGIARPPQTPR